MSRLQTGEQGAHWEGDGAMLRRASSIRTGLKCWVTRVALGHRGRCPLGRGWGREPLCIRTLGWRQNKRMYYVIQKSFLWVAGVPDHEPGGFQRSTSPSLAPSSLRPSGLAAPPPQSSLTHGLRIRDSCRLITGSAQKIFISYPPCLKMWF